MSVLGFNEHWRESDINEIRKFPTYNFPHPLWKNNCSITNSISCSEVLNFWTLNLTWLWRSQLFVVFFFQKCLTVTVGFLVSLKNIVIEEFTAVKNCGFSTSWRIANYSKRRQLTSRQSKNFRILARFAIFIEIAKLLNSLKSNFFSGQVLRA